MLTAQTARTTVPAPIRFARLQEKRALIKSQLLAACALAEEMELEGLELVARVADKTADGYEAELSRIDFMLKQFAA